MAQNYQSDLTAWSNNLVTNSNCTFITTGTSSTTTGTSYNHNTISTNPYQQTFTNYDWDTIIRDYINTPITIQDSNIRETIREILNEEKEKNKMSNCFGFGPYNTQNIRLSVYGMAVKNKAGKWVAYDKKEKSLIDVQILNIDIDSSKVFYKVPKAIKDVSVGDIILHNDTPVFVEECLDNGKFSVINPYEGTAIMILPLKSPFGFNYITQIISITDLLPKADKDNPFGNLLPLIIGGNDNALLMMMMMGKDMDDIDPMMLMAMSGKADMSLYFMMKMMKDKDKKHNVKSYDFDDALDHMRASCNEMMEE